MILSLFTQCSEKKNLILPQLFFERKGKRKTFHVFLFSGCVCFVLTAAATSTQERFSQKRCWNFFLYQNKRSKKFWRENKKENLYPRNYTEMKVKNFGKFNSFEVILISRFDIIFYVFLFCASSCFNFC